MTTVYRYELKEAINDIELPKGAEILSIGLAIDSNYVQDSEDLSVHRVENEKICLWAKVDTSASLETRRFLIFGTGANMDDVTNFETSFIGTVQKKNKYAFHIFEVKNK